jgi:4-hydroxybenzoate polyprenyltransferase
VASIGNERDDPECTAVPSTDTNASRLLYLVQVSRPIIWPVLPLVYALGVNAAGAEWSAIAIAQLVTLTFPMNLIGCGLNDIYDYDSDRLSVRRRAVWGAVVSSDERPLVFHACVAMIPIVILASCLTRNRDNFVATISLVVVAWAYSVPPYRLKERPPLDSLANGFGYFLFPLMMGYSLNADTREMPLRYYLLALCVAGIHALATAADYDADLAAGHRTFAVVFGRRTAATFACAAFLATWYFGEFNSAAVRVYLVACAAATLPAVIVPRTTLATAACVIILVGFGVAGSCHLAGLR